MANSPASEASKPPSPLRNAPEGEEGAASLSSEEEMGVACGSPDSPAPSRGLAASPQDTGEVEVKVEGAGAAQPCQVSRRKRRLCRKPKAGDEPGPSWRGWRLQLLQDLCRTKGDPAEGELGSSPPQPPDDVVQLIDEHGVYSTAKLVPGSGAEGSPLPPQQQQLLPRESEEGEEFEIREVIVDEKPFQCTVCAKAFKRAWELFSHEVVHNEERPFRCQLCQASFKRHSDYKSHALVHTEERPHRCEVCGKRFKRASNLAEHRRIHSGERPHRCGACAKRFKTPYELQRHALTHCAERPFSCPACGKGFAAAGALLLHQRQHCDDKPHICGVCG
uniref:C2H2-type domain-containing protein n=1 Tax=Sphenodon punctatus TaxID=8508 RepID=A0A8D0HL44_SPHPU